MIRIKDATLSEMKIQNNSQSDLKAFLETLQALGIEEQQLFSAGELIEANALCAAGVGSFELRGEENLHAILNRSWKHYDEIRITVSDAIYFKDYRYCFERLLHAAKQQRKEITLIVKNANCFGVALIVEWVLCGGECFVAALNGLGGYVPLEEVLVALHLQKTLDSSFDLTQFNRLKVSYERLSGEKFCTHKAILGDAIFHVSSGIHVNGVKKDPSNYEPFPPSLIGAERKIILSKYSGKSAVLMKLEQQGLDFPENQLDTLLRSVKEICRKTGENITDEAFEMLVNRMKGEQRT